MLDTVSLFDAMEAENTEHRVSSRRALALAHNRIETNVGRFLRGARTEEEFLQRLGLVEEDFNGYVTTASQETGHEHPEHIAQALVDHYRLAVQNVEFVETPAEKADEEDEEKTAGLSPIRNSIKPKKAKKALKRMAKAGRTWEVQASGIHIKHPGQLHEDLGVPQDEKIPEKKVQQALHSDDPKERQRAQFAENAKHWHHGGEGKQGAPLPYPTPEQDPLTNQHGWDLDSPAFFDDRGWESRDPLRNEEGYIRPGMPKDIVRDEGYENIPYVVNPDDPRTRRQYDNDQGLQIAPNLPPVAAPPHAVRQGAGAFTPSIGTPSLGETETAMGGLFQGDEPYSTDFVGPQPMENPVHNDMCVHCGHDIPWDSPVCEHCGTSTHGVDEYHGHPSGQMVAGYNPAEQRSNENDLVTCPACGGKPATVGGKCSKCHNVGKVRNFGDSMVDAVGADIKTSFTGTNPLEGEKEGEGKDGTCKYCGKATNMGSPGNNVCAECVAKHSHTGAENQNNTDLDGPEPKMDKRLWTPQTVQRPDYEDGPRHPTKEKDPTEIIGPMNNEDDLTEIHGQGTFHKDEKLPSENGDKPFADNNQPMAPHTDQWGNDGQVDPVTNQALSKTDDVYKGNPLVELLQAEWPNDQAVTAAFLAA